MVFEMNLNPDPFEKISSGKKTVELRLYDRKRSSLNIGDYILFSNTSDPDSRIAARIKALYRYGSFLDLFSEIPPDKCGYADGTSPEEAVSLIRKYYSEKREHTYGVVGIKIALVDLESVLSKQEQLKREEFERLFPDGMK